MEKATNEIGVFIPTTDLIPDISGRTVTVDALLTQMAIAAYLHDQGADILFVTRGKQKDPSRLSSPHNRPGEPDLAARSLQPAHGCIKKRETWTATEPVAGISFPRVEKVFPIKRITRSCRCGRNGNPKRIGVASVESVYGIASRAAERRCRGDPEVRSQPLEPAKIACIESSMTPRHGTKTSARSGAAMAPRTSVASEDWRSASSSDATSRFKPTIEMVNRNQRHVLDYLRLSQNTRPRAVSATKACNGPSSRQGRKS